MRKALSIAVVVALGAIGTLTAGAVSAHAGHTITVTDGAVNEGSTVTVTVRVSPATENTSGFNGRKETITVGVATVAGSATAPDDFTNKAQTLTFAPGTSTQTFTVATVQDALAEGNETFTVRLSNPTFVCVRSFGLRCPSSGSITDDSGLVTIVDDEAPPPPPSDLSISDAPGKATIDTDCVHTVTLSPAASGAVTVDFAATGAVNQLGNTSGSLSFAPGETTKTLTLDVVKQKRAPGLVTVTLSNAVGANIVDDSATCVIKKKPRAA
jgi:hypothetical protein